MTNINLERFTKAHAFKKDGLKDAKEQLANGAKTGHWIWWIFPQIKLGSSPTSVEYAIHSVEEVLAYLGDASLRQSYIDCLELVLKYVDNSPENTSNALGRLLDRGKPGVDTKKFISSITLFAQVSKNANLPTAQRIIEIEETLIAGGMTSCSTTLAFI